jgi:ketosteroid isomerase-like protein
MSQENVEAVERLIAALNAGDVDQYLAPCTPDVEYVSPAAPIEGIARGEEGVRATFSAIAEGTTSFSITVEKLQELDGDRVLALTRITVVSQHGVPGDQPTASLYYFAGPKVRRIEVFLNRADALEAAGLRE